MTDPVYIDTGRSDCGWSFWGPAFACDQLWYQINVEGLRGADEEALTQGSMGHVLLAHHYARLAAADGGIELEGAYVTDPDDIMDPVDAVHRWARDAERQGTDALCFFGNTKELYRQYRIREPYFADKVVAVEQQLEGTLGWNRDNEFGLWTDANLAAPELLDCPGLEQPHPKVPQLQHGKPIRVTKRLDRVVRSARDGRIYPDDHKVTAGSTSASVATKYAMDGQFGVTRLLAKQVWPDMRGMRLNLVQRRDPWGVALRFVDPSPRRDAALPRQLFRKAHHLADMLVGTMSGALGPDDWEMTQSDLLCYHRFGKCKAFHNCMTG